MPATNGSRYFFTLVYRTTRDSTPAKLGYIKEKGPLINHI